MRQSLVDNWFYPVATFLLLAAWASLRIPASAPTGDEIAQFEAALIFDAFVSLPLLYWLCFRKRRTLWAKVIGMVAVACGALWLAGWIVPREVQVLLPQLGWLRPIVLAGLVLIELQLAIAVFRIVFKAGTQTQDLEKAGVPPLVARLMLAEARFWRWVFSIFRR